MDRAKEGVDVAASMADVAALAGVSQRTVSNVVRGYVHVRPETRQRVQAAMEELRYRPNASARALRASRTGIIALAVPYFAQPYFAELAEHVQRVAAREGLTLLMDQTGADPQREALVLDGYRTHVIDGLIFSPMALTAADMRRQAPDLPMVLLGEEVHDSSFVTVAIDNVAAAREATAHLLSIGRRRIGVIGADLGTLRGGAARGRLTGFLEAHAAAECAVHPGLLRASTEWFRSSGYSATTDLLDERIEFDALLCLNDVLAIGALRALVERKVTIPDDVAVVGWDDVDEAAYTTPSLTSVCPDKAAIAEAAVAQLLEQIAGSRPETTDITCAHSLRLRESTGEHP
ncbi:MAG TPA: LacI family DNA-binding transcriptional regulator [Actinomycetales bacterium]